MAISVKRLLLAGAVSVAVIFMAAGCGGQKNVSLESIYEANRLDAVLEVHDAVQEEFSYYEYLTDEATYMTHHCFMHDENNDPLYIVNSFDTADDQSEDNFSYWITKGVEYYRDNQGNIEARLLNSQYRTDFYAYSMALNDPAGQTVDNMKTDGDEIVVTSHMATSDACTAEELEQMEALAGQKLVNCVYVYRVNKETQNLNSLVTYFEGEDGSQYKLSEEVITYDSKDTDIEYIDEFRNPENPRTITVIEETDGVEPVTDTYSIPANLPVSFRCFIDYYGFEIFNDASGLDPYIKEIPDEYGNYPSVTFYARQAATTSESGSSK